MKTYVYQGVKGAYSHLAAENWDPQGTYQGEKTFEEVFKVVSTTDSYGMVALENTLIGSIWENYDLFAKYPVSIMGEYYQRIDHCLLSVGNELRGIKKVFSHPKALEQCSRFFKDHPWIEKAPHFDTAGAAAEIATWNDPEIGAIASKQAACHYGLNVIEERIQDHPGNMTRFACISKDASPAIGHNKCSLQITLPHTVGSLAVVLDLFAKRGLNVTKIESRPLIHSPFEYIFYLDYVGRDVESAIDELKCKALTLRVLGLYKRGDV